MRAAAAAIVLAGATLIACSAHSPYQGKPEAVRLDRSQHDEITALWIQIRQWRLDAHLGVEPDADTVMTMSELPVTAAAGTCELPPPAATGTCHDVCDLGHAICDNADEICRISDQLGDDVWARDKCDSAKASCHQAEERCCACRQPGGGMP